MAEIICQDACIERNLRRQIAIVTENGGFVHPAVEIVVSDSGAIHVETKLAKADRSVLITVPAECLPSLNDFQVTVSDDRLIATPSGKSVSGLHVAMMSLVLELYNLTDKISTHRSTFPSFSLISAPEIASHLAAGAGLTGNYFSKFIEAHDQDFERQVLETYFASRVAKLELIGATRYRVLMPIIDLLNHHCASPRFINAAGSGIAIGHSQPGDSNECFLRYHNDDAVKTFLQYGFVDKTAQFVHCVPMVIDLPSIGRLELVSGPSRQAPPRKHPLIDDLEHYMPQVKQVGPSRLLLSHLIIPPPEAITSLRRVLEFLIRSIAPVSMSPTGIGNNVEKAEKQILKGTQRYYSNLAALLKSTSGSALTVRGMDMVRDLTRHQLDQLDRYTKEVKSKALTFIGRRRIYSVK